LFLATFLFALNLQARRNDLAWIVILLKRTKSVKVKSNEESGQTLIQQVFLA
jgi:hypothetical protein